VKSLLLSIALLIPIPAESPMVQPSRDLGDICRLWEVRVWNAVTFAARRHGVEALAGEIYETLWNESRFQPMVRSSAGALGIAQFMPRTWAWCYETMRGRGLLRAMPYSPTNFEAAIDVTAWAWSVGMKRHWDGRPKARP
jgi:hypothetical protein